MTAREKRIQEAERFHKSYCRSFHFSVKKPKDVIDYVALRKQKR